MSATKSRIARLSAARSRRARGSRASRVAADAPAPGGERGPDEQRRPPTDQFPQRSASPQRGSAAALPSPAATRPCCRAGFPARGRGARSPSRERSGRPSHERRGRPAPRRSNASRIRPRSSTRSRERPRAGALRKPHRDLIDGEHAVAVAEAPDGTSARETTTSGCRGRKRPSAAACTADGPASRACTRTVPPRASLYVDASRPGRFDTEALEASRSERGRCGSHQMISATLAFRPDPIPMQRTRSPGAISVLDIRPG